MDKFEYIVSNRVGYDYIEINGKGYHIPQKEIENNMKILNLSKEDAIQLYLDDNGYTVNEEVEELTAKAKANKTDKIVVTDKTKTRAKSTREPKENPIKERIIAEIAQFLHQKAEIVNIKIENKTKLITFQTDNRTFKLDLIEKRVKKT